jgi:RNA recognition motif-containing protein
LRFFVFGWFLSQTSNLFVANLPSNVTEQSLGTFFARHGPVGSVKIMWPRGDVVAGPGGDMTTSRRNRNAGLSGFVSFMKRKDAEAALREIDGLDWGGSILRVGWSKAVPMAAKALYGRGHSIYFDRFFSRTLQYQAGHPDQGLDHEDTNVGAGASHIPQGVTPGLAPRDATGPLDVLAVVP